MAVSADMVRAYAEEYTLEEIQDFRRQALAAAAANLPRVEITGGGMKESSSQGQFIEGDPKELVATFNAVIDSLGADEDAAYVPNPQVNHMDFSRRNWSA